MNDILRFHLPCKIEYTKLVEDFIKISASYLHPQGSQDFTSKLCTVMNEVFVNIIEHTNTAEENEIVRFQFEIGLKYFSISIYDYGPGFKANDHLPPYPKECIGQKYKLRDVLDGTVYYTVTDPFSISFSFIEKDDVQLDDLAVLDKVNDNGLGMSLVTKLMDTVTYSYIGNGKFDWKLVKKLE
ncbi:MAG: ATP-binding protein [Calditrichaeota bacterium]|nr:MAG: ATP-binding protein [Calditrichota bacterium]MBL1203854.1 ATP-binding protein [Calditrichota bacterium]NOG43686.1 ATP-binding protein [Calditrichota bacterium]